MATKRIDVDAIHERFKYEKHMITRLFKFELDNVENAQCYFDLKNAMRPIHTLMELINKEESSNNIDDMYETIEKEDWNSL